MKKIADAYFSPHYSYFYTDLNTEKQINEEPNKRKTLTNMKTEA